MKDQNTSFHLQCIGINHWKANLDVREAFYVAHEKQVNFIQQQLDSGVNNIFIVSTCNRTEVFFESDNAAQIIEDFCALNRGNSSLFEKYGFHIQGQDAIRHLFELACGIDSMILGDMQIISQIKAGAKMSNRLGGIKGPMYRLLDTVIKAYKEVRTDTQISSGAASVAHAGVLCVKNQIQDPTTSKLLLIGMGKIGEVTCQNLLSQGFNQVTLMNRTEEKAARLSSKFHFEMAPFSDIQACIETHDIILVATSAPHYILIPDNFQSIQSPKLILDLATPRNVHPDVGNQSNIQLVNLDMLNRVQDDTLNMRLGEIPKVKAIIEKELKELTEWLELSQLNTIFKDIKEQFNSIKIAEIEQYQHLYSALEFEKLGKLTDAIVNKLARKCITQVKQHYKETGSVGDLAKLLFDFKQTE